MFASSAEVDIDSAASFVIDGRTWTTHTDTADSAIVQAGGGLRVVSQAATAWRISTALPADIGEEELLCIQVEFEPDTWSKNAQNLQLLGIQNADGATEAAEDLRAEMRLTNNGTQTYRGRSGYHTGSAWSLSYWTPNPTITGAHPANIQIEARGHGNTWTCTVGTSSTRPPYSGIAPVNSATARVCTRTAGTVSGATPAEFGSVAIVVQPNGSNIDIKITGFRLWRSGRAS